MLLIGWWVWQLFKPADAPRKKTRREHCFQNIQAIGLAMAQYHQRFGSFPPAYVADSQGRPQHSWRVLLLPFLGEEELYDEYRRDEPWDSPHNSKLIDQMPLVYRCPSDNESPLRQANVAVVTGPGTLFDGPKASRREEILDGPENTLLFVEVADSGCTWTEPRDLPLKSLKLPMNSDSHGISSHHPRWVHVVFANGRAIALPISTKPDIVRALCTSRGGEKMDEKSY
jgi:hypothetical protein